jgi:disulfide bond formation protein DsbB
MTAETDATPAPAQTTTERLRSWLLPLAWLQALVATVGSLYFSEVMRFVPCNMCWYQRIMMYPLVAVFTVSLLKRDDMARRYGRPLAVFGLAISIFHNLVYYNVIAESQVGICLASVPCTTRWFEWLGFISIPQMSLVAFIVITVCLAFMRPAPAEALEEVEA